MNWPFAPLTCILKNASVKDLASPNHFQSIVKKMSDQIIYWRRIKKIGCSFLPALFRDCKNMPSSALWSVRQREFKPWQQHLAWLPWEKKLLSLASCQPRHGVASQVEATSTRTTSLLLISHLREVDWGTRKDRRFGRHVDSSAMEQLITNIPAKTSNGMKKNYTFVSCNICHRAMPRQATCCTTPSKTIQNRAIKQHLKSHP